MAIDISFESLSKLHCTTTAATILPQSLERAGERNMLLNHPFTVSIALWTLLRWERKVAYSALESLNVDLCGLEKQLNELLETCDSLVFRCQEQFDQDCMRSSQEACSTILGLVERAKQE